MDLRNYFLGASEALEVSFDLSGLELGGVKPFCAPVKVQGWLKRFPHFSGAQWHGVLYHDHALRPLL